MKIEIPAFSLVILIGPSACGKSTFIRKFFKETQIVCSDHCRAMLCDDESNQDISAHAFELLYFIVEKRLFLRRFTVIDSTGLSTSIRKRYLEIAKKFQAPVIYLVFNHSIQTCYERNLTRKRVVENEVIERQHRRLQEIINNLPNEDIYKIYVIDEVNESDVEFVIQQNNLLLD